MLAAYPDNRSPPSPTMAFKNGLSERLDELRFPSPRSPPSESPFPGYTALSPGQPNLVSALSRPSGDVRSNLHRRFTTDSSKVSSWNYANQPDGASQQVPDPLDLVSPVCWTSPPPFFFPPLTGHPADQQCL